MLPTDVRVIVALDPYGRALMKRDMELVREILLHVESRKDAKPKAVRIEGYEDPIVVQHVEMLLDTKLLKGLKSLSGSGGLPHITVIDLTWSGHEFISALKNKTVWNRIKTKFGDQLAELPLPVIKEAGIAILKEMVKGTLGFSDS